MTYSKLASSLPLVRILICLMCSSCASWDNHEIQTTETVQEEPRASVAPKVTFFFSALGLMRASEQTEDDGPLENALNDVRLVVGPDTQWGESGIVVLHQYTTWLEGFGPESFRIPIQIQARLRHIARVAHRMKIPIMLALQGSQWSQPGGDFQRYWKTRDGGKFLKRYSDQQVNDDIKQTEASLDLYQLEPYLDSGPYIPRDGADALFLTSSFYATEYRSARLQALTDALLFWRQLDAEFPGTITALNTDSEPADASFRRTATGKAIPIGYESFLTEPYCASYQITHCAAYFHQKTFDYVNSIDDRRWFAFRAENNRRFVQDTVDVIRAIFPSRIVYTHQLTTEAGEYLSHAAEQDFASPPTNAFIPGARAGFDMYIRNGHDARFRRAFDAISRMAADEPWAIREFQPLREWNGTHEEATVYTHSFLSYLYSRGVRVIAPHPWITGFDGPGIRDSGAAEGIRRFLEQGPIKGEP